jgi:hypothetical protein
VLCISGSCQEFSLERKRGGHRKKTRVKEVQKEKSKRRQESKKAEQRREREREYIFVSIWQP